MILVLALLTTNGPHLVFPVALVGLVGSAMGLFARYRADENETIAVEDYGYTTAKALLASELSGYAAILGVVLAFTTASLLDVSHTSPTLETVFNLRQNPAAIGFAVIFGLSPALLVDRAESIGKKLRENLANSQTGDGN